MVLGQAMPVILIRSWEVSIRPREFDNYPRLFGVTTMVRSNQAEYRGLMQYLTTACSSLLDLVDMAALDYTRLRARGIWWLSGLLGFSSASASRPWTCLPIKCGYDRSTSRRKHERQPYADVRAS